jgi:RimJ/RimL family protein N-acetyltransferase
MTGLPAGGPALPIPDPPLVDADLLLRPWGPADAPVLAAAWADPEVARWTGVPTRHDEAAARRWIEGDEARRQRGLSLDLVIDLAGVVVGEVGLTAFDAAAGEAEVGWWLGAPHRGRGYASRSVRLLADWAVDELAVDRLVARCHRANPASGAVARRAGFVGPEPAPDHVDVWRSA